MGRKKRLVAKLRSRDWHQAPFVGLVLGFLSVVWYNRGMIKRRTKKLSATSASKSVWDRIWHYLLVVLIGLLLTAGIWGHLTEVINGTEAVGQFWQLEQTVAALRNGHLLSQVEPATWGEAGYGYGLFVGPLATVLAAGLSFLTGSWSLILNLLMMVGLVVAGVVMCYVVTRISRQRAIGALAGIFYMAMPYVLGIVYQTGAVSEMWALAVAPLLLLGLYQLTSQQSHATRTLALAMALLILLHSGLAVMLGITAVVYVIIALPKLCNWESIWRITLAAIATVGLAAFYLVPLVEAQIVDGKGFFEVGFLAEQTALDGVNLNVQRVNLDELLLGSAATDATLGMVALVAVLGFWFMHAKLTSTAERYFVTDLYILGILGLVLVLPIMNWEWVPVAWFRMQAPTQFLALVSLVLSVVAAYVVGGLISEWESVRQRVVSVLLGVGVIWLSLGVVMLPEREYLNLGQQGISEVMETSAVTNDPVVFWRDWTLGAKLGAGITAATLVVGAVWFVIDYLRSRQRAKEHADAEMVMNSVRAAVEDAKQSVERSLEMENLMLAMPNEPVKPKRGRPRKTAASKATDASVEATAPKKTKSKTTKATKTTKNKTNKTTEKRSKGGEK